MLAERDVAGRRVDRPPVRAEDGGVVLRHPLPERRHDVGEVAGEVRALLGVGREVEETARRAVDGEGGRTAKRSFRAASTAYVGGGLSENIGKAVRNAKHGLGLGFEVDGDRGLAGFERTRRLAQSVSSTHIALSGRATGGLLRRLTSTWTHVFSARKQLFSIFSSVFRAQPHPSQDDIVFNVPRAVRSELLMAAALAPLAVAEMRAEHSTQLLATDASDDLTAICATTVEPYEHRALWRHRVRQGYRTTLTRKLDFAL